MRLFFTTVFILLLTTGSNAQTCTLSGRVINFKDTTLTLNLLYAGAHYHNQSVEIKLNAGGKFKQTIALPYPVFALLKYNEFERRLLLSPGRNLHLSFNALQSEENILLAGTAGKENNLLNQLKIGDTPFFIQVKWEENVYAKMPIDSLEAGVLQVVRKEYAAARIKIESTPVPGNLQQILLKEYKYVNQCFLYDFAGNFMRWAKNKDQEQFLNKVISLEPLPDSATLVSCLYANMMVDNYTRYRLMKAGEDFRKDSVAAKHRIEALLQMPFAEINKQAEQYGERYILSWLYARHNLPEKIQDKVLFNKIMESCNNKLFSTAKALEDTLQRYYPTSSYFSMARLEVNKLRQLFEQQSGNTKIVFHTGKKIKSLKEFVQAYKGKVVYLDIWGTWCGPCRVEMGYVPELKKRYAGKDIVFVYLDMDDDNKENLWKEMAYLYELEGEHYRLNNDEIQSCWKEIENEGGVTNRYPTYVLFDRDGKMVKANAERPGSREKLYKQLDEVL